MNNLAHIGVIKDLLDRHGFTFSKQLGQNFLINPSVCPRMAESARVGPGYGALEIGPGIGVLTRELCRRADRVRAIEIDARLLPVLDETLRDFDNVKVIHGDVLEIDLERMVREEFAGLHVAVAANLPYYITTPVIMRLLESRLPVESVTVMVQKEAGKRICAKPGTRAAGAVTAAVWYYSEPEMLFPVSRGSFLPAPNVDSCVVRLNIRAMPPVAPKNEKFFFKVIKSAFSQRRKTVLNALSSGLSIQKDGLSAALAGCGVASGARAEELTLEQFCAASDALFSLSIQNKTNPN